MPYIHVTLASGRTRQVKRELTSALTDAMERVLEVARIDIPETTAAIVRRVPAV